MSRDATRSRPEATGSSATAGSRWNRWRAVAASSSPMRSRSEEHTSELQSLRHLVCRLLLAKNNKRRRRGRRYIACFFNDTATTEISTLSLHDALPILDQDGPAGAR